MGTILCATRGGEASVLTEEAAIRLAAAGGDEIIFFYVVDVEFMAHAKYTLRSDVVHEELQEMAEFLMAMAIERAQRKHVKARALVRHGVYVEELISAAAEVGASRIVLGRPAEEEGLARLEELAQRVAEETGIPVSILP
jgi:nucleotide-binding universal stress UspA family protein